MKLTNEQKNIVKKYGHFFNNTGGNNIVELIERADVNYFNNVIVAELQSCCASQVLLMQALIKNRLMVE